MARITRNEYVGLYGPTTGDRIRLGDTGLFVEIERDLRGPYGDEVVFGGGKSLREGQGMDNQRTYASGPPDLVITNAVYFKAAWATPFSTGSTTSAPFETLRGVRADVPTMHGALTAGIATRPGYVAVDLPYEGNQLSMTLLVPDAGTFDTFEAQLTPTRWQEAVGALRSSYIELDLPRFTTHRAVSLGDVLGALGMPIAFTDAADFSGIAPGVAIGRVEHDAFIAVDEKGTEAAAATAVTIVPTSIPLPTAHVTVDRPFLYAVRDVPTGAILFLGRVTDPR